MWARLSNFILKYRLFLLTGMILCSAFMLNKGKDIELSHSGSKVLPVDDPAFITYNQFKKDFGEDGTMMVIGLKSDKIFEKDFLNDWYNLGIELKKIEGITEILSVTRAFELLKETSAGTFAVKPIMSSEAKDQNEADSI